MSMEQLLDAIAVRNLPTPAHRFVLMAIADDASETSCLSWPGNAKLCEWADVGDRRISQIITDLGKIRLVNDEPLVERVQAAHRGRRAVYKINIPVRDRRKPVDNPAGKPEAQFPHSRESQKSKAEKPETRVLPSPVNLSETDTPVVHIAHQPRDNALEPTTTGSATGEHHKLRTWLDRVFRGGRRHGILRDVDLEQVITATRTIFGDDVIEHPGFLEALDDATLAIVRKGSRGRRIERPTAYVIAALRNEPEIWRATIHDAIGYWPDTPTEEVHDDHQPPWHRAS